MVAHAEGCPVGCGDPHQRDAWVGGGLDYLGQGELTVCLLSHAKQWEFAVSFSPNEYTTIYYSLIGVVCSGPGIHQISVEGPSQNSTVSLCHAQT